MNVCTSMDVGIPVVGYSRTIHGSVCMLSIGHLWCIIAVEHFPLDPQKFVSSQQILRHSNGKHGWRWRSDVVTADGHKLTSSDVELVSPKWRSLELKGGMYDRCTICASKVPNHWLVQSCCHLRHLMVYSAKELNPVFRLIRHIAMSEALSHIHFNVL